jgi:hypothetical protein
VNLNIVAACREAVHAMIERAGWSMLSHQVCASCRHRNELEDDVLLGLVGPSFRTLDLSGCTHLRPSTLRSALRSTPHLRHLDLAGCSINSAVIYALPWLVPGLKTLRLAGDCQTVELEAWERLIPGRIGASGSADAADTWEQSEVEVDR